MLDELKILLDKLLRYVPDAKKGIPQEVFYFISQLTPLINVDLLIKDKAGKTLLTWRDDKFHGPAWHIPGGIIRFKEDIESRIQKVAETELGCTVRFKPEPIFVRNMINTERDVRGHFVSLLYICELTSLPKSDLKFNQGEPSQGQWCWHKNAPENLLRVHEPFRKYINETKPL